MDAAQCNFFNRIIDDLRWFEPSAAARRSWGEGGGVVLHSLLCFSVHPFIQLLLWKSWNKASFPLVQQHDSGPPDPVRAPLVQSGAPPVRSGPPQSGLVQAPTHLTRADDPGFSPVSTSPEPLAPSLVVVNGSVVVLMAVCSACRRIDKPLLTFWLPSATSPLLFTLALSP